MSKLDTDKTYTVKYTHKFKLLGTKNAAHKGYWSPSWDAITGVAVVTNNH